MSGVRNPEKLARDEDAMNEVVASLEGSNIETMPGTVARVQHTMADLRQLEMAESGGMKFIHLSDVNNPTTTVYNIPRRVMYIVFDLLDYESVMECRWVCKAFYSIVTDPRRWTEIPEVAYGRRGRLDVTGFSTTLEVLGHYPNLRTWIIPEQLNLRDCTDVEIDAIADKLPKVRTIKVRYPNQSITRKHVSRLLTRMTSLRDLTVGLSALPMNLAFLTHLSVYSDNTRNNLWTDLPLIESASLQKLHVSEGIAGTVDELLTRCPNIVILKLPECYIEKPLMSPQLRSLVIKRVTPSNTFENCPMLTDFQYETIADRPVSRLGRQCDENGQAQSCLWSNTIRHLKGEASRGYAELNLKLFPNIESYTIKNPQKPIESASLKKLAISGKIWIPRGSFLPRLEWLYVQTVGALIDLKLCNWPRALQTLMIDTEVGQLTEGSVSTSPMLNPFLDPDETASRITSSQFIKEVIESLPCLRHLRINATLECSLPPHKLTRLEVCGFENPSHLIETVTHGPTLEMIWLNYTKSSKINWVMLDKLKSLNYWQQLAEASVLTGVKICVPMSIERKRMPKPFKEMLISGRVAYFDPYSRSHNGHLDNYFP